MTRRITVFIEDDELKEVQASAVADKRDPRDQLVVLALKALREEQRSHDKEGCDGQKRKTSS